MSARHAEMRAAIVSRVGYRKPGTNTAPVPMEPVCTEPNQNAGLVPHFGVMPEQSDLWGFCARVPSSVQYE